MALNRLRVLTYHRVLEPDAIEPYFPQLVSAYPSDFEQQISWLSRNYEVIDIDSVLSVLESGKKLPRRAVLVTFDDGYPDFAETAWPILKAYGVPATLFVPTNYPGDSCKAFWWDELYASLAATTNGHVSVDPFPEMPLTTLDERRATAAAFCAYVKTLTHSDAMDWLERVRASLGNPETDLVSTLNWSELRGLVADGVAVGAHSRTHALLTSVPRDELHSEIAGSRADVERELGGAPPIFCYPAGAYDRQVVAATEKAGIKLAFTTKAGHNIIGRSDVLALRRLNVTLRTTMNIFRLKLSVPGGYADRVRKEIFH